MGLFPVLIDNGSVSVPFFTFALLLSILIALSVGIILLFLRLKSKTSQEFSARLEIERFYEVLGMAPDGYFSWFYGYGDTPSREVCSRRLAVLLGLYKGLDSDFSAVLNRISEEDREEFKLLVEGLRLRGSSFAKEVRISGTERRIITLGCRSESIGGIVLADTIWMRDITENADSMEQLYEENRGLEEEYNFIKGVLDALPFPLWVRDDNLALNFCNKAYVKAVGSLDISDVLSKSLELAQGDALRKARSIAAAARSAGRIMREKEHIVIDGCRHFSEISEIPLLITGVKDKRLTVGMVQILDREEELENRLKSYIGAHNGVLENLTTAIVIFDSNTRLSFYNSPFLKLWGLDADWLDASPTYSSFLEALREKRALPEVRDFPAFKREELELFKNLLRPGEDLMHLPQGKTLRRFMLPHPLGGILISYEDITDRIAMERSFNTLIEVQRATIDNIHEAVALFDTEGKLKLYNSSYADLWGFSGDFLNTNPLLEELVERHKPYFSSKEEEWQVIKGRIMQLFTESSDMQIRIERLDGKILESSCVGLADGGVLITFFDITHSARTEKILKERSQITTRMNALRSRFIFDLAAEFKDPFTELCSSIKKSSLSGPVLQRALDIKDLFNDLMDLALAEGGSNSLNLDAVEIRGILEDINEGLSERALRKEVTVNLDIDSEVSWIIGDKTRLEEVLHYIFACSLNKSGKGKVLTVSLRKVRKEEEGGRNKDWVEFSFVIEAFGEDNISEIFPSYLGAGESLVKSLVSVHGGYMSFEGKESYGILKIYLPAEKVQ